MAAVLKTYGIDSQFKRPNDILVNGKKICGILVEASTPLTLSLSPTGRGEGEGKSIQYAVIGIGLNVNADPSELLETAISMKEILRHEIPVSPLQNDVLAQFSRDLEGLYAAL